jgi:hypothetical protein
MPIEDSDLMMKILAQRGHALVASPDLVEKIGAVRVPAGIDWVMLPGKAPGHSLVKVTSCRAGGSHHSVDVQVYRPRSSG